MSADDLKSQHLCRRHGAATVRAASDEYLACAERKIRAAIRRLPPGVYRFTDHVDGDGVTDGPIAVTVAITVEHDRIRSA